jgi:hypothetical protein
MDRLQVKDVGITCECGSSFTLTEAFRNAIYRDRSDQAPAHLIADWVEVATLRPNIGSLELIPFRSRFAAVFRVDLSPSVPVNENSEPLALPGPLLAIPYWVAPDGFALLTVWSGVSSPEGCRVTYTAYGSLEGGKTPDWVKTIHSARRLEMQKDFDCAIALLGVATEAFARSEFLRRASRAANSQAVRWEKYKQSRRGLRNVLKEWADGRLPSSILDTWNEQVWQLRNLTFHEERTSAEQETFRSALDTTLALVFGLRPAAMLEVAGVTPASSSVATNVCRQPSETS